MAQREWDQPAEWERFPADPDGGELIYAAFGYGPYDQEPDDPAWPWPDPDACPPPEPPCGCRAVLDALERGRELPWAPLGDPWPARDYTAAALTHRLERRIDLLLGTGWTPRDFGAALRARGRVPAGQLRALVGLLRMEALRHGPAGRPRAWDDEIARLLDGAPAAGAVPDLETRRTLLARLCGLPGLADTAADLDWLAERDFVEGVEVAACPGAASAGAARADRGLLAEARAELGRAVAAGSAAEARQHTSAAEKLLVRRSLAYLAAATEAEPLGPRRVHARRIWLRAPYLNAKVALVDALAAANGCRSAFSRKPGVTTLVGSPTALDTVELLAGSLVEQSKVQALQPWGPGPARPESPAREALLEAAERYGATARAQPPAPGAEGFPGDGALIVTLRAAVDAEFERLFPPAPSLRVGRRTAPSPTPGGGPL